MTTIYTKVDYEKVPGICMHKVCREDGPRCVEGYCHTCCSQEHAKDHPSPPKAGDFAPLPATLIAADAV